MTLFVLGDSHVVALGTGYQLAGGDTRDARFAKLFPSPRSLEPFHVEAPDGVYLIKPEASKTLSQVIGRDHFSPLDSDHVFAFSLGFTPQPFLSSDDCAEFTPWNAGVGAGRSLLSDGVIRAMIAAHFRHVEAFISSLRRLGLRCVAIGAPPMMEQDHWIADGMSTEAVLAIDALVRATMTERFEKLGVPSVPPPPETFSQPGSTGFRRPGFKGSGRSGGHGDAIYGQLMLARLRAAAAALERERPSP